MKKEKIIIITLSLLIIIIVTAILTVSWLVSIPKQIDDPKLKAKLESVYATYLNSIDREDPNTLLSVLTHERIQFFTKTFELNNMKFPDDYFKMFKELSPKLPATKILRYVGLTKSDKYANLIYVGSLQGYLRNTTDEKKFFLIQFEKEGSGWKYSVCIDPPTNIVPYLEDRLRKKQLYFLKFKPFTAEKIELLQ